MTNARYGSVEWRLDMLERWVEKQEKVIDTLLAAVDAEMPCDALGHRYQVPDLAIRLRIEGGWNDIARVCTRCGQADGVWEPTHWGRELIDGMKP